MKKGEKYSLGKVIYLTLFFLLPGQLAGAEGMSQALVAQDLLAHLTAGRTLDWNRIASLVFPLAMRVQRENDADAARSLATVVRVIEENGSVSPLSCADAVNIALTAGFLADARIIVPPAALQARRFHCNENVSPFEAVNILLYRCRYGVPVGGNSESDQAVRAAVTQITALQQRDGRFTFPGLTFLKSYYLSSHALLALHACRTAGVAVKQGQVYLQWTLELFHYQGFLDGLAESLIFLAWTTQTAIPGWAEHVAFLRARVQSDGGVCFADLPGCHSHWHTTALMVELESLDYYMRNNGTLPPGPFASGRRNMA